MNEAVITWVDSDRPGFVEDLAAAAARFKAEIGAAPSRRATLPNRFRENGCLRFCLRSIRVYAPWIERIILVTSGELPAWLDSQHPAIHVVTHDEIFPSPASLPTFNSCAIESCLHRIPSLGDRYIYFNDDIFLTQPLAPDYFQDDNGVPRFTFEGWQVNSNRSHPSLVAASAAHCRSLLDKHFGFKPVRLETPHEPILFDREMVEEMESIWPSEYLWTRNARFRTRRDFVTVRMYLHYRLERELACGGKPMIRRAEGDFVGLGAPHLDLPRKLDELRVSKGPFLCVNDETDEEGPAPPGRLRRDLDLLHAFLLQRFPNEAPWER